MHRADRMDRTDRTDRIDRTDRVDRTDRTDRTVRMNRMDRMDRTDMMDRTDRVDRTDRRPGRQVRDEDVPAYTLPTTSNGCLELHLHALATAAVGIAHFPLLEIAIAAPERLQNTL